MNASSSRKKRFLFKRLLQKIRQSKRTFILYIFLCLITIAVIFYAAYTKNWMGCFNGLMTLLLFLIPPFLEETLKIEIPTAMEILVLLFIFASQILGEVGHFYVKYPFWDDLLHATNGLLFGAFGFALADLLNRRRRFSGRLSPFFLAVVACCFSLSIGVLWEFFEFSMDQIGVADMQKDSVLTSFSSGFFSADGQTPVMLDEIQKTVIYTESGETFTVPGGYLDIGKNDTVKDLFVDFLGALLVSIPGYFYLRQKEISTREVKKRRYGKAGDLAVNFAGRLIPVVKKQENVSSDPSDNNENSSDSSV